MEGRDLMKYCYECGHKLEMRILDHEGMIPFCSHCQSYRFPIFNTAVSMITLNPQKSKLLMIQQYGRPSNILVAGYVNKGESVEETLRREMKEEIGRDITSFRFMKSEYFPKSNTLILNYAVVIESEELGDASEWEIDDVNWFSFTEAPLAVKQNSLAQRFLNNFLRLYEDETATFFSE